MTTRLVPPPVAAEPRSQSIAAFGLTPRALWLLGAGLLWIVPAWFDRRALLMLASWDLLVLALIVLDVRRLPSPASLTVSRRWTSPLILGVPTAITIEIHNRGRRTIDVECADYVSGGVRLEVPELALVVAAGGRESRQYDVVPRERGDAEMGDVALRWRHVSGLAQRWATAPLRQTVRTYPNLEEGRHQAMYLVRSKQIAIEKRRTKRVGLGRDFDSLRDYRPGDERRDVCWSASARRGKLVTKVYQPERSQTVWILVDAGRLLRARVGQGAMLDTTVTAALTLAQVALASGDRVGLLAYGRRIQQRVAPARGASHLRTLLEALAVVRADGVEADHASAAAAIMLTQKRRALVAWLTDVADTAGVPDVIDHAQRLVPTHVVLFGVMRQPELAALSTLAPATSRDMYRVMAAQEALDRRQSLLHGLQQKGALVLEVSPRDLSTGLVDRYLAVKERGLL